MGNMISQWEWVWASQTGSNREGGPQLIGVLEKGRLCSNKGERENKEGPPAKREGKGLVESSRTVENSCWRWSKRADRATRFGSTKGRLARPIEHCHWNMDTLGEGRPTPSNHHRQEWALVVCLGIHPNGENREWRRRERM